MSMTPDEQAVKAFLEPLRSLPPVTRRSPAEARDRRWRRVAVFGLEAITVCLLVGLIALVAYEHAASRKPTAPPDHHPRRAQVTYLWHGGIATGPTNAATGFRLIVRPPHRRIDRFAWSPDGQRLAYLTGSEFASGRCTLYIVDVAHRATTPTPQLEQDFPCGSGSGILADQVRWSPNGHDVAYWTDDRIFAVNVATGARRLVTHDPGPSDFTWWPGGRLAYPCHLTTRRHGDEPKFGEYQYCSILPDGSHKTLLHINGSNQTWSPASGRVAYLTGYVPKGQPYWDIRVRVWTASPSGAGQRLLTQGQLCSGACNPYLDWSPDGRSLMAVIDQAQIIDAATGHARYLKWWHLSPSWITLPAWRP